MLCKLAEKHFVIGPSKADSPEGLRHHPPARREGQNSRFVVAAFCCVIGNLAGLTGAAFSLLRLPSDAQAAGIVLPPFTAMAAMRQIAATGLPIVDIRLGGRLVIVMIAPDGHAISSLRTAGLIVIAANAPPTCTGTAKETRS